MLFNLGTLRSILLRDPLVTARLPAGRYTFLHIVHDEIDDTNSQFGEVTLPDDDLASQLATLAETAGVNRRIALGSEVSSTDAETFLSPLGCDGADYRRKLRAMSRRGDYLTGFSYTGNSGDWRYRDTNHFESWSILLATSDAAIAWEAKLRSGENINFPKNEHARKRAL